VGKILGIDLGTTNSAVAYVNDYGRPEVLVNDYGERITPSVVLFDGEHVLVGSEAKNSAVMRPLDTVQFVKRQMGNPDWRFETSTGRSYSAEEVSAFILRKLKQDAERTLGEPVTQAVISVPAYFDDARRKATQDAGRIAGLDVLRIVNEPTAAAIAFGLDSETVGRVLVFDLGGGTFDATAMEVRPGNLQVIATGGDPHLGGFDWDNEIMQLVNERYRAAGGPDLFVSPETEQDLRGKVEQAKKRLSQVDHASLHLSAKGFTERVTLTREEFDAATEGLLDRASVILDQVREEAGWSWPDIDKLLLVGGSTRMPQVPALIRGMTGHTPSAELNPDEVVAMGAAIQGALIARDEDGSAAPITTRAGTPVVGLTVRDVTAHGLGVISLNPRKQLRRENSIVIPKNTAIPASESIILGTVEDRQDVYLCEVTEGEEVDPQFVRIIGTGDIKLPGTYPEDSPMEVSMCYDADGIIHVFVKDLVTNRPLGELHIDRKANLSEREVRAAQLRSAATEVE
jgi:molecular chaperone DnaK